MYHLPRVWVQVMPAGVLAGSGLLGLAYHAHKARQWA